jgi:peptide deformylase
VSALIKDILKLGDPLLYSVSSAVTEADLPSAASIIADLEDTMGAFRRSYGFGRAIASPQIGAFKRIIYMNTGAPLAMINPALAFPDDELMEVMDDCMCFPGLLVRVLRHRRCILRFNDLEFKGHELRLEGDLSELIQHEFDHLDGILATMRAIDSKSFYLSERKLEKKSECG